jgi:hypothetical protein
MLRQPYGHHRRLSWGYVVLRGLGHLGLGRSLVPPGPFDVHRPAGVQPTRRPSAEASGGPPWTCAPLQSASPGNCAIPPVSRLVRRHFLSWTFFALRHSPRPVDTCLGGGSLHHHEPRAGFGYPLRDHYHRPSRRFRVGASMSFTLQGVPFVAIGTPLGALAFLPLPVSSIALRRALLVHTAGFKALFLRRIRAVTGTTSGSSRRYLLGVLPSRACSHSTWRSL